MHGATALVRLHVNMQQKEAADTMRTRIKELRQAKGVSQSDLAVAVGVSRQTIISIEGERYTASLPLAYKIARYFDTSIEAVFDFSDVEDE